MTKLLEPHPFANVFPLLDGEAFDALVKDIEVRGQQEPIWVYEGKILDGRNRYRACQILGRDPIVREFTGDDAMGFVLSANLHRRHLNEGQRAMVGASLANLVVGANQHTKELGLSTKAAADLLKVSTASIERAKVILKSGDPELIKDVTAGETSVAAGVKAAKEGKGKPKNQSQQSTTNDKSEENSDKHEEKPETEEKPEPETEEDKLAKEKQKLSDTNDRLVEKLMENLKKWKDLDEENALTATSNLLDQLKAADLIEERKRRKAA
jgi:ParB-like chromosome segregation protein Spo0J